MKKYGWKRQSSSLLRVSAQVSRPSTLKLSFYLGNGRTYVVQSVRLLTCPPLSIARGGVSFTSLPSGWMGFWRWHLTVIQRPMAHDSAGMAFMEDRYGVPTMIVWRCAALVHFGMSSLMIGEPQAYRPPIIDECVLSIRGSFNVEHMYILIECIFGTRVLSMQHDLAGLTYGLGRHDADINGPETTHIRLRNWTMGYTNMFFIQTVSTCMPLYMLHARHHHHHHRYRHVWVKWIGEISVPSLTLIHSWKHDDKSSETGFFQGFGPHLRYHSCLRRTYGAC